MLRPKAVRFSLVLAAVVTLICLSSLPDIRLLRLGLEAFPALAHEVEIADDIGGTLHIEPSDTPRAGEEVLAWVALRSQGGQIIGLEGCDCQLSVYAEPGQTNSAPLLSPELTSVEGDGIEGIPGAEFTFPNVGLYTLVMTGSPKGSAEFTPFELAFDVTVAAGVATTPSPADTPAVLPPDILEDVDTEAEANPRQRQILLALGCAGIVAAAASFFLRA